MKRETWLPVVGYENFYEVSSHGRVRSLERICMRRNGSPCRRKPVLLKQSLTGVNRSYLKVNLTKPGSSKTCRVASLVAEAFLGPRPDGMVVAHGPEGSLDNSLSNLSYKTPAANQADRLRDGTDARGAKHHSVRLNEHQVLFARKMHKAGRGYLAVLARAWGVTVPTLYDAVTGRNWGWL